MEKDLDIAGPSSSDRRGSLEEFPVSSGGLYTLADILTSINRKQSKVTPSVINKKKAQDDPDSSEWKEYQAKRIQALKILKQEKEHRLKEEMKRLGLKTVTPDLRSRLEAQFQYLHEALLPDSGLEEDQEAAARAVKAGKRKSKKSTSVHWSQDVLEKDKKIVKSKNTSNKNSSKTSTTSKSKSKTVNSKSLNASGSKSTTLKKKSTSLTKFGKSKTKRLGKVGSENKSFDSEIKRLETIEAGAKNLLHELSDQFGSLDKPSRNSEKSSSNPLTNGVFTDLGLDKIKSRLVSSPKLKAPSQFTSKTTSSVSKKPPRSSSLGRLKGSKGSKTVTQSSGYGQHNSGHKRLDNTGGNSSNSTKKSTKPIDSKNTGIFKKVAAQQNAISNMKEIMDMKIPKKVVRSKSEVANTPKLKAVPLIGGRNTVNKPVSAGKSRSTVVTGARAPVKSKVTANINDRGKLPTVTAATTNVFNPKPASTLSIRATRAKSLDTAGPLGNNTVIAELYPVNSKIAAAVGSFIDKESVKSFSESSTKDTSKGGTETDAVQKGHLSSSQVRPAQRKPPKFPTVDLCNVFPGTQEWDTYWEKFNGQITNYYAEMDDYLKSMNDFTMDLEDYSKELKKIQMGNQAFAMKLGLNPNYKSSPSIPPKVPQSVQFNNTPLEPGVYNVNGYVVKCGGGRIPGLRVTTVGDEGFSLELDLGEIDIDPQLITVETEFNIMTITVPVKTELGRVRIIQIRVPSRSSVNNLSLREVQRSTKKGIKSRILNITGN